MLAEAGGSASLVRQGGSPQQYAFPRQASYDFPRYGAYGFRPFAPRVTRAEALRDELKELETEIGKLSAEKE